MIEIVIIIINDVRLNTKLNLFLMKTPIIRAEKIDKANKQLLEEKLLDYQSQENHDDQNIAELAIKNSSFIKAVLDKIG